MLSEDKIMDVLEAFDLSLLRQLGSRRRAPPA